jgi:HK97 family phage major capsid protein
MSFTRDELKGVVERHFEDAFSVIHKDLGEWKDSWDQRFKKETQDREALERKVNNLRLGGGAPVLTNVSGEHIFLNSIKSHYPHRSHEMLQGFDYPTYCNAFKKAMRYGMDSLSLDERKAMSVGSDPDGGWMAPGELAMEIIRIENNNSVVRQAARVMTIGAGHLEVPVSLTRPVTGWVGETQARTSTEQGDLGLKRFDVKELFCMPEATQTLIDDSAFPIEQFVSEEIGMAFAEQEDAAFIAGDGLQKPRGFTTMPTSAIADSAGTRPYGTLQHIPTGVSGNWPATDKLIWDLLVDTTAALKPAYRQGAAWMMGVAAKARLRKMKDDQGMPLWHTSVREGEPDMLLGYPVWEAESMPAIAANSYSVAFANWQRAYWVVDRVGVRMLRDPFTNKPYVRWYTTKRVAGGVADSAAIKLIKFATT